MKIHVSGFTSPKLKEKYKDNHDRIGCSFEKHKFAISDGVTLSFYPSIWVDLLMENFLSNEKSVGHEIPIDLNLIQKEWYAIVENRVKASESLYLARNKFYLGKSGSATFLGLQFFVSEKGKFGWKAIALGDSFLFYVKKEKRKKKLGISLKNANNRSDKKMLREKNRIQLNADMPLPDYIEKDKNLLIISSSETLESDNNPDYFDSKNKPQGEPVLCEGDLVEGNIYLMTDALADWYLKNREAGKEVIHSWTTHEKFIESITELRKKDELKNDDTSILKFEIIDDKKSSIAYELGAIDNIKDLLKEEKQ